jgi:transposase
MAPLVHIKLHLSRSTRKQVSACLQQAYRGGEVRVIRRIEALLHLVAGQTVAEVADLLGLGEQTVRDYLAAFLHTGMASLAYGRSPGRPGKLTPTQRQELAAVVTAGPLAAGYPTGCWSAVLIGDWLERHFGVVYHPHYLCQVLDNLGFSFQKARFVSDHLNAAARAAWMEETWPRILRLARQTGALLLFGDEASFAQWGSLSYTWARKGQQPTVKTSGKRKGYKVLGLIDYFTGRLFFRGQTERFNAETYQQFLTEVMAQTQQPLILIQDGARYHTSQAMQQFFAAQAQRLTVVQLPGYSPDFNPIEYLWKKVKRQATHLRYFPAFASLIANVDDALLHFAQTPSEITALMGCYCESLGEVAV